MCNEVLLHMITQPRYLVSGDKTIGYSENIVFTGKIMLLISLYNKVVRKSRPGRLILKINTSNVLKISASVMALEGNNYDFKINLALFS